MSTTTAHIEKPTRDTPAFEPDPELIGHLEGDEEEAERYRRHARNSADEARRTKDPHGRA